MGLQVIVPPAVEPLTLDQAKRHLRVDFNDDDGLISDCIAVARERIEDRAYTKLITQTLLLTLDRFPWWWTNQSYASYWWPYGSSHGDENAIELIPPVQSITSVNYVDPSGTPQTLAPNLYRLDTNSRPCRLTPALGTIWPATAPVTAAASITFVGGFGNSGDTVPPRFIGALKFLVGHYYLNREQILSGTRIVALEIPEGFDDLLQRDSPPLVA